MTQRSAGSNDQVMLEGTLEQSAKCNDLPKLQHPASKKTTQLYQYVRKRKPVDPEFGV